MKTTIEKQVVLNGSYGINKRRPANVQNHTIAVWHVVRDGKTLSTHATRSEADKAAK